VHGSQFGALDDHPDADGVDPAAILARLRELLEQSDAAAVDWWQAHRARLRGALPGGAARSVGNALNAFDFDAALAALEAASQSDTA
jgi:hypothetical protein